MKKVLNSLKNQPLTIKLLNINCRSIKNKINEFATILEIHQPDVVLGTESWLDDSIPNSLVFPSGYEIYRRDRSLHGGGIFICVKSTLTSVFDSSCSNSELLWCYVSLSNGRKLRFAVAYRPPDRSTQIFDDIISSVSNFNADTHPERNIIIGGDLNLPGFQWDTPIIDGGNLMRAKVDPIRLMGFEQIVKEATRVTSHSANVLDVVLVNCPEHVQSVSVDAGIGDHCLVLAELNFSSMLQKPKARKAFVFAKANIEKFGNELSSKFSAFLEFSSTSTSNESWNKFKEIILKSRELAVPTRQIKVNLDPPWYNKNITYLKNKCRREHSNAKKSQNFKFYKEARAKLNMAKRNSEDEFVSKTLESDLKERPKQFWNYGKHKTKGNCSSIPTPKSELGEVSDSIDKANLLNNFFQSVFTCENLNTLPQVNYITASEQRPYLSSISISKNGIEQLITGLNTHKSAGPDGICARLLQLLPGEVSPYLDVVFQKCLDEGCFPEDWKKANISPIFKKGSKSDPNNYRPISLTSICGKLFEHILTSNLASFLDTNKYFHADQFGFRKNRSCEMQLARVAQDIALILDSGREAYMVFLDFAKAFDKVPHQRLLAKVKSYGISGNFLKLIESFLSNRSQAVVLEGVSSDSVPITSGVPQGSVLGPLLFLIYINDLPNGISSKVRLFADDTLLYLTINKLEDLQIFQKDLQLIDTWCDQWQMSLNYDKCEIMHIYSGKDKQSYDFNLGGFSLKYTESYKYLGVELQRNLKWDKHIASNVVNKGKRTLYVVRKVLSKARPNIKQLAYFSLIRPIMEYASSVWDPSHVGLINAIEMVQRSAARFCTNRFGQLDSVMNMIEELGWTSLSSRRYANRLSLFSVVYSNKDGLADLSHQLQKANYRARQDHNAKVAQIRCKKNIGHFSFLPRSVREWNALPSNFIENLTFNDQQKVRESLLKLLKDSPDVTYVH